MKKRMFISRDYHNIIILILILSVLFFFGKILLNKNYFIGKQITFQEEKQREDSEEKKENEIGENKLLVYTLNQVFPTGYEEKVSRGNSAGSLVSSLLGHIFKVDFKNPLTFVQAQFPSNPSNINIVDNIKFTDGLQGEEEDIPEDIYREIFFVDLEKDDTSLAVGTVPKSGDEEIQDRDNLGETVEEIYMVGDEEIVDSLDGSNIESLNVKELNKITLAEGKPHILIYHTHGTESYNPASEGNFHTLRKEYSVMEVGRIIADELEKKGYNVIHDTTYHDYPSYSGSYTKSLETARRILKENPSIQVVLDIHRDGYDNIEASGNREILVANNTSKIKDKNSTKFQFVIGPESPNRKEVEIFANYIKAVSDSKYPGFAKPVLVKPYGRFNQFLVDHYALIEVGSNVNTIEEAKNSAKYLANVLADSLDHIKK